MRRNRHVIVALAWALALALVPVSTAGAQVTTATLTGRVTSDQGVPLPGVQVVLANRATRAQRGIITREGGFYTFAGLQPGGPYRVEARLIGYGPEVVEGVQLALGQTQQVNFVLRQQAVAVEGVSVTATRDQSLRSGVGTVVNEEVIENAPAIGRDFADYTRLTPQAYVENDDDDGPAISIAGQNNRYNTIYIDGTVNNDVFGLSAQGTPGGQTGATPISMDAIEQVQIAISPFDVTQSGFTGGAVNAITRSGSNRFEGSLYSFFRNENLVGNTPPQLVPAGAEAEPLPEFSNNRYGFRLGGPIIENKLFFFTNVELLRSETPAPFNVAYQGASVGRLDLLRDVLVQEVGYDPGVFGDKASTLDDNKILGRVDWNINGNHRLMARYSYLGADNVDAFQSDADDINFSNNSEIFPNRTHSLAVDLVSSLSDRFANKLLIGFTRVNDDRGFAGKAFPFVQIRDQRGDIQLGSEQYSTANVLDQDIFSITNNFNWFLGDHTVTIGTHNEFYSIANLFIPQNFGRYEYKSPDDFLRSVCAAGTGQSAYCQQLRAELGGSITPVAPRIYQRGYSLVDNVAGDASEAIGAFDAYQLGVYIQDEWQATDRLRLTGGVRVDVPKVTTEPRFAPDVFETTIPALRQFYDLNGAEPGKTPAAIPYVSPRLGFNYDISGDGGTQLRGGVGVFTGRVPFVWPGSMFLNNGTNTGYIFRFGGRLPDGAPVPFIPGIQDQLTGADFGRTDIPGGRLEIFEENFRYPSVMRSSLGLDAALPGGFTGSLIGQYTNTISNINVVNVNLNPNAVVMTSGPGSRPVYFGDVAIDDRYSATHRVGTTDEGYTYDLTAQLQNNFGGLFTNQDNLYFNLSYTFGDGFAINDGTSSQINSIWRYQEVGDFLPNNLELSRSDFSIGHRVLGMLVYETEFLKNLGTSLSLVYTGESGRPFSYVIDNSDALIGAPGGADVALIYVPRDAGEIVLKDSRSMTAAQQGAALDRFIASSEYLSGRRGSFAERNGLRFPFENVMDLKLEQEVFGNVFDRRQSVSVTLDIFNFTNLLNRDWGTRYRGINGSYELIEFQGFRDAKNGDFTPVYTLDFDPERTPTEDALFESLVKDSGTYSSRWFMQLGLRYTF
jgi:hypothetical protein